MVDDVVAVVPFDPEREEFLILRRCQERRSYPGCWEFPSGFIEDGETPRDAGRRELIEETGLDTDILRCGKPFVVDGFRVHPVLSHVTEVSSLSREHDAAEWVSKSALVHRRTVPRLEEDVERVGL